MPRPRTVIKIGSSLLAQEDTLTLRFAFMHGLLRDISELQARGREVVLLSSGAVALGLNAIGRAPGQASLLDKQAAAACGQPLLLDAYRSVAREFGLAVAQVLVTLEDMEFRDRYISTTNTIERLFEQSILPIINENDTVATQELRVGDNDRLAAKVAEMVGADELVILTSIDGVYDRSPSEPGANFIPEISDVSEHLAATDGTSVLGSGGMKTKLQAANMAQQVGCTTLIGEGVLERPVLGLLDRQRRHTRCVVSEKALCEMSAWLSNRLQMSGAIVVDEQLATTLRGAKCSIPRKHIAAVHGDFQQGQVVHVYDASGVELARGVANVPSDQLRLVDEISSDAFAAVVEDAVSAIAVESQQMICVSKSMLTWESPGAPAEAVA